MAKIDLNDYLEKLTEPEDRETVANRAYQRELFEQYVTKDGNFPEQRAQLLEDFRAGKELTGPKGLRRKLGAFDLEYFGRAYLAHYFVRPSPKFHGELDRTWRGPGRRRGNPRGGGHRVSPAGGGRPPAGHPWGGPFYPSDGAGDRPCGGLPGAPVLEKKKNSM